MANRAIASFEELQLDRIFWPAPKIEVVKNIELIAFFVDDNFASYLLKRSDTNELLLIRPNDKILYLEKLLTLISVEDGQLLFKSENNLDFVLNVDTSENPTSHVEKNAKVLLPETMRTAEEKVQFSQAKELARNLGVPNILVNNFDVIPNYGFSRGGRKGLLLDDDVPKLFFTFTPFEQGDILLGVDGIPFTNIDKLLEHINVKGNTASYAVELQRDKRLRLLNVYMK